MTLDMILFDLDGTLWDSSQCVTDSWNLILDKNGLSRCRITVDDMRGFMGKRLDDIARMMMPDIDEKRRAAVMNECAEYECGHILKYKNVAYYPKLRETLETLAKNYKLAIVSNCQDGYIQVFLELSGLSELFCDFESAGATGLSKGENNLLVMKRNAARRAVYVGDTEGDLESADFAGIPFIRAAYGFGCPTKKDAEIAEFSELPAVCEKIFRERFR